MLKRFLAAVMLLALTGSVAAGLPLHIEQQCPLMGGAFDCCAVAHLASNAPQASAARLCCAINCTLPGTSGSSAALNLPQFIAVTLHDALPPASALPQNLASSRTHTPPAHLAHAPPAYLRHLALLI